MSKLYPPQIGGTIPAFYNGQPVTWIGQFNHCTDLTHVFIEKGNNIQAVSTSAFDGQNYTSSLKYFDFSHNTIKYIATEAFRKCPLTNTDIGANVMEIGPRAFNGAFSSEVTYLNLPANLQKIDELAFAYLGSSFNATLMIGSGENYSKLDLTKSSFNGSTNIPNLFYQNQSNLFETIWFYSKYYQNGDQITLLNKTFGVEDIFKGSNADAAITIVSNEEAQICDGIIVGDINDANKYIVKSTAPTLGVLNATIEAKGGMNAVYVKDA